MTTMRKRKPTAHALTQSPPTLTATALPCVHRQHRCRQQHARRPLGRCPCSGAHGRELTHRQTRLSSARRSRCRLPAAYGHPAQRTAVGFRPQVRASVGLSTSAHSTSTPVPLSRSCPSKDGSCARVRACEAARAARPRRQRRPPDFVSAASLIFAPVTNGFNGRCVAKFWLLSARFSGSRALRCQRRPHRLDRPAHTRARGGLERAP